MKLLSIVTQRSEVTGVVYLSLDHVLAVQAEVKHAAVQVDGSFRVQLLQNPIQGDERPCTADTSTNTHTHTLSTKSLQSRGLERTV